MADGGWWRRGEGGWESPESRVWWRSCRELSAPTSPGAQHIKPYCMKSYSTYEVIAHIYCVKSYCIFEIDNICVL